MSPVVRRRTKEEGGTMVLRVRLGRRRMAISQGWWSERRATLATVVAAVTARGRGWPGEEEGHGRRKKLRTCGRERRKVVTVVRKGGWLRLANR